MCCSGLVESEYGLVIIRKFGRPFIILDSTHLPYFTLQHNSAIAASSIKQGFENVVALNCTAYAFLK